MMPGIDGFGLLRAVRGDPALRGLPVILLSARAGEEAKVEGLEAGADDYLTKPFSARELLARVSANIQLAQMRREAERALRRQTEALTILNRAGAALAGNLVSVAWRRPGGRRRSTRGAETATTCQSRRSDRGGRADLQPVRRSGRGSGGTAYPAHRRGDLRDVRWREHRPQR